MNTTGIDVTYLFSNDLINEWEPIEAWQVEAVERAFEDNEHRLWGRDGTMVLAWFDLGDTRSALYDTPLTELPEVEVQAGAWERMKGWVKAFVGYPPSYRLVRSPA